jgi:hypothetical protein
VVDGRPRSSGQLARRMVTGIDRLHIEGEIPVLAAGQRGWLITPNHYYRPSFGIWWMAVAISACFPVEVRWVMASQWRDLRPIRRWIIPPASAILFPRFARAYGFSCMPAMPPMTGDTNERALAVRRLVEFARKSSFPVIGIAPEGMDTITGELMLPHAGVGRLLAYLASMRLRVLPVGVYEEPGCLVVRFGQPYQLLTSCKTSAREIDRQVGERVMLEIADLLPVNMRRLIPAHW